MRVFPSVRFPLRATPGCVPIFQLVLRASRNPHADVVDHLAMRLGHGITGWVAEHREPVSIPEQVLRDPRFKLFRGLPEDLFEAMLSVPILSAGKVVGVIYGSVHE